MRFSQQEQLILSLKSKLLKYEHANTHNKNNSINNSNQQHQKQQQFEIEALLDEKSNELQLLHQQLTKRDAVIEKQKFELDSMSNDIVNKKRSEVGILDSSASCIVPQLCHSTQRCDLKL